MVLDLQGQLLPNMSAEKYSDPSNRVKLSQIYKEKEIKKILTNKDHAKHEKGTPGNPNSAQHMKRVPTPQRFPTPSQTPQKAHSGGFILKPTSNSRIPSNNILAGIRNTTREKINKINSFYPFMKARKTVPQNRILDPTRMEQPEPADLQTNNPIS